MRFKELEDNLKQGGELHHAFLVQGSHSSTYDELVEFLESAISFKTIGNPDFHFLQYDSFGIGDTRTLQRTAIQKPLGEKKIFIFSFKSITTEAQNALLKLFEEPTPHTHFFLLTSNTESLLPTLRSRLYILPEKPHAIEAESKQEIKKFLGMTKSKRIAEMKKLIEEKDKEKMQEFLTSLESEVYEKLEAETKDKTKYQNALKEILRSKQYIQDRSSSSKLLLEHVALVTPKM